MPSSIEKLLKFFKLEQERGYDNRAVVGGLDKIIPAWESEARSNQLEAALIEQILSVLQRYPQLAAPQREEALQQLVTELSGAKKVVATPNPPAAGEPASFQRDPSASPAPDQADEADTDITPTPASRAPVRSLSALNSPLTVINGIGPKHASTLTRIGLNTLGDLMYYFPRRYDDYTRLKPINRLEYGEEVTVIGVIQAINTRPVRGGASQLTEAVLTDGTGQLRLTWFNRPWLTNQFRAGAQVVVAGKLNIYLGRLVMNSPEIEEIEREHLHTNRIVPVYALASTITQKWLRRVIFDTVKFWAPRMPDYLPQTVRNNLKLVDLGMAILNAHFPESQDALDLARWRLAFDEIFLLQLGVMRQKRAWQAATARSFSVEDDWLQAQIGGLPYSLTGAQAHAVQEIRADLASGQPMDRLLQGDVGSGKTVVAALAVAMVTHSNAQAALMAPTSILAEQHYRGISRLLTQPDEQGAALLQPEQIRLLVGDTKDAEKEEIRAGLADGSIKLVIGTHALIEDPVQFQELQLVVIDEQHRFGVAQRAALRTKGASPHLLVMTATPIPRSLALTVYGDLDLLVMDEMPPGRQVVETHVLHPLERERAYQLVRAQVAEGHQAFIIYPQVEQGEEGDDDSLAAVESHSRLQQEVFPKLRLGLLHGRLRPDEKDHVMSQFRDGEYDVLVATSVVEVGVDVPNATVMIVEGANRFGLAQLHQFRGRVGRGDAKSYCLLIPDSEDALENQRLSVMAETNDGFVLAERDLEQRGPGEFLGTRQAGFSELQMANLTDVKLIEKARAQAQIIFRADPDLEQPENAPLLEKLTQFWGGGRGDVS